MERLRQWILPICAVILIAGAAIVVLWLSEALVDWPFRPGRRGPLQTPSGKHSSAHRTTYRFLFPSERQAVPGKLTLGRFVNGRLCEGATWAFDGIDQWYDWAPSLFERETQWVAEEQPGWRISQWLTQDEGSAYDRDHLFWSIQALRFLDPESLANEIDMIEHSNRAAAIRLTEGPSGYDYDTDTLCWNPASAADALGAQSPNHHPWQSDSLAALAHQLNHAWHDLCHNGDGAGPDRGELLALMAENRIRHTLYLKDPTYSRIRPRTQRGSPKGSPEQAWTSYRGRVSP